MPLYHQIAEALRNAIAIGELGPGTRLPAVRDAAAQWGVNLHTVRRAYGELAQEGLVRVRGALGTEVATAARGAAASRNLDVFLATWLHTAREQYGLTPVQLGQLLLKRAAAGAPPRVHFIECSYEQAEGHTQELMRAWRVDARPLVLSQTTDLPSGILLATYFHYNDIRQRWPHRLEEIRFLAVAPDGALKAQLPGHGRRRPARRLIVCELDEPKAVNITADVRSLFGNDAIAVEPRVVASPARLPRAAPDDVLLVTPRVWGALTARQRERVVQIRYCIRAHELELLGASLGWERSDMAEIA